MYSLQGMGLQCSLSQGRARPCLSHKDLFIKKNQSSKVTTVLLHFFMNKSIVQLSTAAKWKTFAGNVHIPFCFLSFDIM